MWGKLMGDVKPWAWFFGALGSAFVAGTAFSVAIKMPAENQKAIAVHAAQPMHPGADTAFREIATHVDSNSRRIEAMERAVDRLGASVDDRFSEHRELMVCLNLSSYDAGRYPIQDCLLPGELQRARQRAGNGR